LFVGKDARELCWSPHFDAWKTSLNWCSMMLATED
jgi:hypothetical protein